MAVKNATELLDGFCRDGIAVEVTHRSKRRLFGLAGLAPLRDEVAPARRPEPGRGRGRPPAIRFDAEPLPQPPPPEIVLTPIDRRAIDYSDLELWMAQAEQAIRSTRRILDALARGEGASTSPVEQAGSERTGGAGAPADPRGDDDDAYVDGHGDHDV